MEKKKLKLSISGSSKKTLNSIEQAKSKSKNTVVIGKKNSKFAGKSQFSRQNSENFIANKNTSLKPKNFIRPAAPPSSDFEKRKLAEQRATRRIKGETTTKENRPNKLGGKRRELKLTISRALNDEHVESISRSMASLKRAKQKENRYLNQIDNKDSFKQVKRDINIHEIITIRYFYCAEKGN